MGHPMYITVSSGMSGHYAVLLKWDSELDFYDIEQTGCGRYATPEEAVEEGKAWAEDEGVEFRYTPETTNATS